MRIIAKLYQIDLRMLLWWFERWEQALRYWLSNVSGQLMKF